MENSKKIVIFGATSAIAQAVARQHAKLGYELVIVGRNSEKLDIIQQDLLTLGAPKVHHFTLDLNDTDAHAELIRNILNVLEQHIDRVLLAQGTLPNQANLIQDYPATLSCIQDNALNAISLLTIIANHLETQGSGSIGVISSVAGDRGRQSNYIYGASKALMSTFLQGLRNRLTSAGIQVLTIKPGFVDTPMTQDFPKGPLWAQPEDVAKDILKGFEKQRNVIYTPWFWYGIMLIIQHIPEFIFKKLSL